MTGCFLCRGGHERIVPGRYGYGRMPYVMPLQTDTGQQQSRPRGRRTRQGSPVEHQPKARHRGQPSGFPLQTQSRDVSSPQQRSTGSQPMVGPGGVSLYQAPGTRLASHLDSGPPSAACPGPQKLRRMCNTNVRTAASVANTFPIHLLGLQPAFIRRVVA